jgi:hypothetical protein
MERFSPLITYSSPSGVAVVVAAPASEPAASSVKANLLTISPAAMAGR